MNAVLKGASFGPVYTNNSIQVLKMQEHIRVHIKMHFSTE